MEAGNMLNLRGILLLLLDHLEANAGGAAEMLPFHPAFDIYLDAFVGRLLELGFNGFVLEDPESYHVPNQNEGCFRAFRPHRHGAFGL